MLNNGYVQTRQVDSLVGFHGPILHIISRLSWLVAYKNRCTSHECETKGSSSPEFRQHAAELERSLSNFRLPLVPGDSSEISQTFLDSTATAKAYHAAAWLYLYKIVHDVSAPDPRIKSLVRQCLDAIAEVAPCSLVTIIHLWPLFAVGCEATTAQEREFVWDRLNGLQSRSNNAGRILSFVQVVRAEKEERSAQGTGRVGCIEIMSDLKLLVFYV